MPAQMEEGGAEMRLLKIALLLAVARNEQRRDSHRHCYFARTFGGRRVHATRVIVVVVRRSSSNNGRLRGRSFSLGCRVRRPPGFALGKAKVAMPNKNG